ncbi:Predicted membrane protein [Mucilaginibacter gossypiicola]|uniref:Predicted membrane protein n=2 Tax=Mucilaginibacter gossypiicola TaxID=551995 RepID=A0A1H8QTK3_9SPHI|nr:Predicted membrane protein [Mucilaginibacter gossypiicola]
MNSYTLFQICLLMHLSGLTLMAGTDIVEFVAFRNILKNYQTNKDAAVHQIGILSKLSVLLLIGGILLVLSGTGFLIITHNAFGSQLWFKIKIIFVLGLVLNGILMGQKSENRLKQSLMTGNIAKTQQTEDAIRAMIRFHFIQLCIFFIVVLMAVFKFN